MRKFVSCLALPALGAATAYAAPDDVDLKRELEDLRRWIGEMEKSYQARISELEKRIAQAPGEKKSDFQAQLDDLVDKLDALETKSVPSRPSAAPTLKLLDVSFNSLFAVGGSTGTEDEIQALEGGHHDPHKRGFTVQNAELVLSGAVDPYFKAQANVVWTIDEDGETAVELEEAFAQTTSLPGGLQVKAGQYFTEFGRANPQHPHQWEFVDQSVVNGRFFGGDGMRGPGARVSWLAPTGFPLELQAGVQNANGETMVSFLGTGEEAPPAGAFVARTVDTWSDLVWTGRVAASIDLTDETPFLFGVSGAIGPSGASRGGSSTILGTDVTLKWKPLANDHGFPFVAFQAEWMRRHLGFDGFADGTTFVPGGELQDSGGYAQAVWGFQRDWTVGLRFDHTNGEDDDVLGLDDRNRWSLALTCYASEFAKLRLQVDQEDSAALRRSVTSVWLQLEFNLGQHGAHKF